VLNRKDLLKTLHPAHPRLLISDEGFEQLRAGVADDPTLRRYFQWLRRRADEILHEPVVADTTASGGIPRVRMERALVPALVYRLTDEHRHLERAWAELEAAATEPNWRAGTVLHAYTLTTAESATAVALGYDWLYNSLTDTRRRLLRDALVAKALRPALAVYTKPPGTRYWPDRINNWNQVCNGGVVLAALAIADDSPDLAGEALAFAVESLPTGMGEFGPDGGWEEGPGYWRYGTLFNVYLIAALESALGTDLGFSRTPGFSETGYFWIHSFGPAGRCFNFSDCSAYLRSVPQIMWMARKFDRPDYAWFERYFVERLADGDLPAPQAIDLSVEHTPVHWMHLIWYDGGGRRPTVTGLPRDAYFRKCEMVTMRSAWEDRDAVFVGFKAGAGNRSHGHLDAGTFVMDALGVRWAMDLGGDDYDLPGYFEAWDGSQQRRCSYYRLRPDGHNTLVINPHVAPQQDPAAATRITRRVFEGDRAFAVADLSGAYAVQAGSVLRGVALSDDRRRVLIQDEVRSRLATDVWWFMHTKAEIDVAADGRSALMSRGDARLWARILSPDGARFTVMEACPIPNTADPPAQATNDGVRKLTIHHEKAVSPTLAVLLVPLEAGASPPDVLPDVVPLADWR